jgi:hypothetical protein
MKTSILITLSFVFFIYKGDAQVNKSHLSDSCSNVCKLVSYFWKLDSLANNGFRLYSYDRLLNCKVDKVSVDYLIMELGKPNEVRNTNQGIQYVYYYFDSKRMPKEYGNPFECGYIYFMFNNKTKILETIGDGVIDY